VFNLGNERGYSVLEVIESARTVTGKTIPVETGERRPGDRGHLIADSQRARSVLGWRPRYADIETIVSHAWEWERVRDERAASVVRTEEQSKI